MPCHEPDPKDEVYSNYTAMLCAACKALEANGIPIPNVDLPHKQAWGWPSSMVDKKDPCDTINLPEWWTRHKKWDKNR